MRMRWSYALAGLAVLGAGLAIVALAWAQPNFGQSQTTLSEPSEPAPVIVPLAEAVKGSVVSGAPAAPMPPVPVAKEPVPAPALEPPVATPLPAPLPAPVPLPEPVKTAPEPPSEPVAPVNPPAPMTPALEPTPTLEPPTTTTSPSVQPSGDLVKPPAPASKVKPAATEEKAKDVPVVPVRGPLAHQESAIALEWHGPTMARVGHTTDYNLVIRNLSAAAVQEVLVRVRIPQGLTVVSTEPRGPSEGNVYAWELGTLMAKQEKTVTLRLLAEGHGEMTPQAWVTFTGLSVAKIHANEPRLTLKSSAPEKVLVGDNATFTFTVKNAGDGPAEQVRVQALLSEGLEHPRGHRVTFEVGNLAPGESRNVQVICGTRGGGEQKCEGLAEAEGGLKAQAQSGTVVLMPRLELQMVGPALRYVDRKAAYEVRVTNPGDAPATNVTVSEVLPAGFQFVSASDGGRVDPSSKTVSWFLGEIGPGQMREIKFEAQASGVGEQRHQASAQAARGLRVDTELTTRVEGLSALMLDVEDTEDPIEVGGNMSYVVKVTNSGSKTETDIRVVCLIPDQMEFKGAQAPVRYRQESNMVIFEPVPSLAAKAELKISLQFRPNVPGDARFTLQVTSSTLQEPVIDMEATRIYADTVSGR